MSQEWRWALVVPVLWELRQGDLQFDGRIGYRVSFRLAQAISGVSPCPQKAEVPTHKPHHLGVITGTHKVAGNCP